MPHKLLAGRGNGGVSDEKATFLPLIPFVSMSSSNKLPRYSIAYVHIRMVTLEYLNELDTLSGNNCIVTYVMF